MTQMPGPGQQAPRERTVGDGAGQEEDLDRLEHWHEPDAAQSAMLRAAQARPP